VKHHADLRFWRCHRELPQEVRLLANRNYKLLKTDPGHRSLQFKQVGQFWSVRVGLHYRALAVETGSDLVWFWIGSHAQYDKLVGRRPAKKPTPAARPNRRATSRKGHPRG
jgi:hypothetical protein